MARRIRNSKGRFTKAKAKARKSSKRRRNGGGIGRAGFAAARASAVKAPKRRKSRRKAKAAKRTGRRIRPTILVTKSGLYKRPRRSKYFKRPRMVNGRKRRLSRRNGSGSVMAAIKKTLTVSTLSGYLAIGGGVFVGAALSKMLNTGMVPFTSIMLPAAVSETMASKYVRPFQGVLHIVLGSILASKVKNKYVKDAGLGLAALGGYDLLSQALSAVGIANLPSLSGMNVDLLGRTSYSGMNVNLLGGGMNIDMMGGTARGSDAESGFLVDNINDMIS
jgi:hypothetical protein